MDEVKSIKEWKPHIKPVLSCKASEFRLMGYENATQEDIWNCLTEKVWKGNPEKHLYEVVEDIFHLGTDIYLSYLTVNAYKQDDLEASIAALLH
ncbi:post-transcriptional regulator [Virgibacillus sp. 179-BFC.A HS]|uniref:Post-transcriptional regulator n=1 Tax=Tigheibacillus jepli TaxID=3035914 RepID=A0ABU5CHP0_9BACI|nr:post-transcriptional regulator [Virgibacillus sp. 179-BFC.A HS]MDY0405476.1 post-transcriptional regulator [Virgibacillus sp. 179-BFC.A HS]